MSELKSTYKKNIFQKYKPLFKKLGFTLIAHQFEKGSTWYIEEDWQTYYDSKIAMKNFNKSNQTELEKWLNYYLEFTKIYQLIRKELKNKEDIHFQVRDLKDENGLDYKSEIIDFKILNKNHDEFEEIKYYITFKLKSNKVNVKIKTNGYIHEPTYIKFENNINMTLGDQYTPLYYNLSKTISSNKNDFYKDIISSIDELTQLKYRFFKKNNDG